MIRSAQTARVWEVISIKGGTRKEIPRKRKTEKEDARKENPEKGKTGKEVARKKGARKGGASRDIRFQALWTLSKRV
ncbi:MAG: hypothetical protein AB7E52_04150 [Bdellovibrionales bacterium]